MNEFKWLTIAMHVVTPYDLFITTGFSGTNTMGIRHWVTSPDRTDRSNELRVVSFSRTHTLP